MPPSTTVWPLDAHTLAKHRILRGYLNAWFPILGSNHKKIVYYDGFAGPGRYDAGEVGSPLIALEAARQHATRLAGEVLFVFVEQDRRRAEHLEDEVRGLGPLPENFVVEIVRSSFEDALRQTLDDLERGGHRHVPTFAMVDPFGVSGLPFDLIARLLRRPSCEVLVTFMTEAIKRFVEVPEVADRIPELFGRADAGDLIAANTDRVAAARTLYEAQLRQAARARFVRFFKMHNRRDVSIYDLFFATNHPRGHARMKEAMWAVDESGDYSFSDKLGPNQGTMFTADLGRVLGNELLRCFAGRKVTAGEVRGWVEDESDFIGKHATEALLLLENQGINGCHLSVDPVKLDGKPRKRNTFPEGAVLTFPG